MNLAALGRNFKILIFVKITWINVKKYWLQVPVYDIIYIVKFILRLIRSNCQKKGTKDNFFLQKIAMEIDIECFRKCL